MGVKGLFQFLKRFEREVSIQEYVKGKRIGIDIFWFIHLSKGDMFIFQNYIHNIIKNAKLVYCVFDGNPSEQKRAILREQACKRKEIEESIKSIEQFMKYPFNRLNNTDRYIINSYLNDLKRKAWQPPPEYIDYVKRWLENKGCIIHQAVEEADDDLIELEQNNDVDIIITNDSDLLILGSAKILRVYGPLKGAIFDSKTITENLGFTEQMWKDFMYLCKNIKENDIILAYSLISTYKDLDYSLQKYSILYDSQEL